MPYIKESNRNRYYQLATWKACVKLEALGMKHSRGNKTPMIKRELGIHKNISGIETVALIQAEMDKLK